MGNYVGPYSSVLLVFVCWVRGISGVGPSVGLVYGSGASFRVCVSKGGGVGASAVGGL